MINKKSNVIFKVILALVASIAIFMFIVWKFISTDTFGQYLSTYINKYINQYTEVSIRYDKLGAKLFPPGIRIENLEINSLKPMGDVKSLSMKVAQLDVDAKILTLTFDKLQISNIEFSGVEVITEVDITKPNKEEEQIDIWKYWNFKFLNNVLVGGPVEVFRVALNNATIKSNLLDSKIDIVSWEKFRNTIEVETSISNFSIKDDLATHLKKQVKQSILDFPLVSKAQFKAQITEKNVTITKLKLNVEQHEISSRIVVDSPFTKNKLKFIGDGLVSINMSEDTKNEVSKINSIFRKIGFDSMQSRHELKSTGSLSEVSVTGISSMENIKSKYGSYKSARATWLLDNYDFAVSKIEVQDNNSGWARTKNTDIRVDFNSMKIKNFAAEVEAEKLNLSNGLSIVPAVSQVLHGFVSGNFLMRWDEDTSSVELFTQGQPQLRNFRLVSKSNKDILAAELISLNDTVFQIGSIFTFKGDLNLAKNKIHFNGSIGKENIDVKTNEFNVDFNDIKSIAGISTEGSGLMSIIVDGDTKNPKLRFNLKKIQHANIFGFYLGELDASVILDFNRNAIFLENIASKLNPGQLQADGYISLDDFTSDIVIKAKDLSTYDLLMVHKRLLPWNLTYLEKGISTSSINYKISGKINELKNLQVKANIATQRFTLGSEEIYDLRSSLLFKDKILSMPDITFKKGKGTIAIGLSADLNEDVFRIAFKSKNLDASDILFYSYIKPSFNSAIQIEGAYKSTKASSEGVLNLIATKARLNDEIIDDSYIAVQWKDGVAKVQGKYGANWLKLNALVDFNQSVHDAANKSFVTASVNVPNWGKILSLFASFDNDDPVLSGNVNLEFDSLFNYNRLRYADIDFWVKSLSLTHPSLQIAKTNSDRIIIQNGEIKKWDIQIKGIGRDQIISRAYGHIASTAEIESIFDFSLGKLNYFLGSYLDLSGFIQSQLKVRLAQNNFTYLGKIKSDDAILNSKSMVTTLGKTKFLLEFDNKETRLVNWQSQMGSGYLNATGNVNWTNALYPSVTFRYGLNNAKIQMATRSMTILNGQGLVVGTQPPYMINGDIKLAQTEILNEPGDFDFNQGSKQGNVRHLPAQQKQSKTELFLFNVHISTDSPIVIRNSIAELHLLANLNLLSKVSDPRLTGYVSIKGDRKNVFILKNNQFKVNRLNLLFDQRQAISNPALDIDAESKISTYIVRAKVYGTAKNYQLDLNSDPVLQRQSILSLIAFGYADNMNQNMSNEDREALSSAGLGAFIFDQLKLNERLHSNLGLTLNVGTEYLSSSNSLLQGRTQQSGGAVVGQTRTATKLELRKKLDDKVGLSVSSTVGGSAGQKQSMNLNYQVNRNVSLDALYEVNTDVSENQERAGRSAGGDIKFRWTFK